MASGEAEEACVFNVSPTGRTGEGGAVGTAGPPHNERAPPSDCTGSSGSPAGAAPRGFPLLLSSSARQAPSLFLSQQSTYCVLRASMAGEKLLVLDPDDPGFNTVLRACSVTLETSLFF